jgi:hypothetical protein
MDGKASENFFDCFTAFAKASSLFKGLLTLDFPFSAAAFGGTDAPYGTATTTFGGAVFFFPTTFARLPTGLS